MGTSSLTDQIASDGKREAQRDLRYALVIEATEEPDFFGFFSPDPDGFTGIGHSVEDCIHKARWGMREHIALLKENGLRVPPPSPDLEITIRNQSKMAIAA